jgi:putative DNA primase/helicase
MNSEPRPDDDSTVVAAALWYAEHGFPVFPVHSVRGARCSCGDDGCAHPGKHPRTAHGFKDATKDPQQIKRWLERWPDTNIGVPTGSVSGLLVIDIDPRNGGDESWEALTVEYGRPPETAEQLSGGGGRHIFFRDPGVPVPKELAPGIDVKSTGGYIIVARSTHPSGRQYAWDGVAGKEALLNVVPASEWLLSLFARVGNEARRSPLAPNDKWPEGQRNNQLTSLAGSMRRGRAAQQAIEAALLEENQRQCDPPLSETEVRRIAESIASYPPGNGAGVAGPSTPFRLTDEAVLYIDPDPEKEPLKVCGRLEIVALTRDGRGDGWGRLLEWTDAEDRKHRWAIPMSLLAGDGNEYRARLLDGGLIISPGRKVRDFLTTYIQTTGTTAKRLSVSRVGWHGDTFVLPAETIGPEDAERVIFQSPYETEYLLDMAGTLEEWKRNVGQLCSGNSRLVFAASCAFAGPILALAGAECGGLHFVGPSSTGKSTALYVAGSVIGGGGRNGFVQSWRATANGLEAVADFHNDLTLILDELSQLDAREAADVAYLLANGRGKSRMSRSILPRKSSAWRLLFLSAGEITLSDHAQTAGRQVRAGAEVRLLNIEADAGARMGVFEDIHSADSPDIFAQQMKVAAFTYYGTPLRAWLRSLISNRTVIEKALKTFQADFLRQHVSRDASGEVYRAAQRFALIAAAGELATEAGITGWLPDEATSAAVRCYQSWITRRGTTGPADTAAMINQVRRFLEAHGSSRFQFIRHPSSAGQGDNPDEFQVVRDRAGFRRRNPENGETEYFILQETFKVEVCAGHDYRQVRKVLEECGHLLREDAHWTVKPRQLPEMPKGTRVYCMKGTILEEPE